MQRNPDLADTYAPAGGPGRRPVLPRELAGEIAATVQTPAGAPNTDLPVPPGLDDARPTSRTTARSAEAPTHVRYRGLDVYGMAPSSRGGTTVGEALNILERFDLAAAEPARPAPLPRGLGPRLRRPGRLRRRPGVRRRADLPLLVDTFADARACIIDPTTRRVKPVAAGTRASDACATPAPGRAARTPRASTTTHLTVADRWGNVVEYTLTIEQTGGSGIVVPGRGFLLNNELTDFSAV